MTNVKKKHQLDLMTGALTDYQTGLMPLGVLIQKIEAILGVLEDDAFEANVFDSLLALEEVYARTQIGAFDFDKLGKAVVDEAVHNIAYQIALYRAQPS
jgi:hypothetical protein